MRMLIIIMIRYMDGHVPWILWGPYQRWRDKFLDAVCVKKDLVPTYYTAACPKCGGKPLYVYHDHVEECSYCEGEGEISHYIDRYAYQLGRHVFYSYNGFVSYPKNDAIRVERVSLSRGTFWSGLVICIVLSLAGEVNALKAVRMVINHYLKF